jgi:RNA polymerase sigma factor for flagellar operon FliA
VKPVVTAAPPHAWTAICDGQSDPGAVMWASYSASGDPRLREQLVDLYTPYARIIAARMYRRRGGLAAEFPDYMQSALLGLLRAIDRYDPGLAIPFVHFAARHIRGAVLDALPSMSELNAQVLGRHRLRQDRVASLAVGVGATHGSDSLDELSGLALELGIGFLLEDAGIFQPPPDQPDQRCYDDHRRRELSTAFAQLLPLLPERQSRLLRCHYFCDMRFAEIADLMGLSVARVSQLHRVALKGLLQLSQRVGHLDLSG